MANILIADVEKNHGLLLKQELEDDGHSVDMILRNEQTTPLINGRPVYDIILLDMQMPGLNYYERLKRIKGHVTAAHLVVFADTAALEERKSLLEHGADACFAKHEIDGLKEHLRLYINYIAKHVHDGHRRPAQHERKDPNHDT